MMRNLTLGFFLLWITQVGFLQSTQALEPGWMESYVLSATQIRLLTNWQKKGTFSDEKLLEMAQSFHKTNTKPKPYVPEHTFAELSAVMEWAQGAAFATFAPYAGFYFDNKAYMQDCPDQELFYFGRATGTLYFQLDVLLMFNQTFSSLQVMYSHHPDSFPQRFTDLAAARGFSIYLTPQEELQASL